MNTSMGKRRSGKGVASNECTKAAALVTLMLWQGENFSARLFNNTDPQG